jgi:uncharacterized membrane protein YkoI
VILAAGGEVCAARFLLDGLVFSGLWRTLAGEAKEPLRPHARKIAVSALMPVLTAIGPAILLKLAKVSNLAAGAGIAVRIWFCMAMPVRPYSCSEAAKRRAFWRLMRCTGSPVCSSPRPSSQAGDRVRAAGPRHSLHVQGFARISGVMIRTLVFLALAALSVAPAISAQALADPWTNQFSPGQAREAVREGKTMPLSRIFQNLRRDHGGYQLGAELYARADGTTYYEIDWMTEDGRKVQFTVDAQTGQVTGRRGGS